MRLSSLQRLFSPVLTLLVCLVLSQTPFFPWLSDNSLDLLFQIRGIRQTSQDVVIVGIDESSLKKYGPWPFSRSVHGLLLERLQAAKSIGFDLIFSHIGTGDFAFSEFLNSSPPASVAVAKSYHGELLRPPESILNRVKLGHIETLRGDDGVVRRVLPEKWGLPMLALAMVQNAGQDLITKKEDKKKERIINFFGPEFTFLYLSYSDVLEGKYKKEFFKDRYVLVGSKALVLGDVHVIPYTLGHPTPGVEIQATILNNLLDDSFIKEVEPYTIAFSTIFLVIGMWFWPTTSEAKNLVYAAIAVLILVFTSTLLFNRDIFLNPSLPIFVLFVSYLFHLFSQWVAITARLIAEIAQLDKRLEDGIEKVFQTLPTSLEEESFINKKVPLTRGGLHRHVQRIHYGIQALGLQNSFINHLLSEETPPLILWQKDNGAIVLANNRFIKFWREKIVEGGDLPSLNNFNKLIQEKIVSDGGRKSEQISIPNGITATDMIVDIGVMTQGKKIYNRVVVHDVNSEILGFSGIIASFTDVTEIRELERLKGEVMNIVSHELKLPLTSILGFSEMLSESLKGEEKEFADEICSQAKRLAKMIEDFLDIARIESGKYAINRFPFDLLSVVHDAASAVAHIADKKKIRIIYNLPAKTSPLIGDESLITQAVLNLLDNAIKFSPAHTEVTLELMEEETVFTLHVADQGPGINDIEKPKVFEKFIRGRGEVRGSGFGLGLSFVKQVVDGHKGSVSISDSDTGGARFTLVLPKNIYY